MKRSRSFLLATLLLSAAPMALAKAPTPAPAGAVPVGSPGDWIGTDDYPATALRFSMAGITSFRLVVDATGAPIRCDIVGSSGFDALDAVTCARLMAKARFSPSRDRAGKPIMGAYANRVRWVLPDTRTTVTERFAAMQATIDQTGKITSCRAVVHVPVETMASTDEVCKLALNSLQQAMGLEFRGSFEGPSAEVEIRMADVFTPALRERVLSPMPGYRQQALNIHRFTVTSGGKLGQCSYEEQRGSERLANDFCLEAVRETFDPPFAAFDKDSIASGWHIMRVLLKTGQ